MPSYDEQHRRWRAGWMNEGNPLKFSTFIRAVAEQDLTV